MTAEGKLKIIKLEKENFGNIKIKRLKNTSYHPLTNFFLSRKGKIRSNFNEKGSKL